MTTAQEMRELYRREPGKWVIVSGIKMLKSYEKKTKFPNSDIFSDEEVLKLGYRLILKEHEHIIDAVIANPNVKILVKENNKGLWCNVVNFFEDYCYEDVYQLAKPQCENCGEYGVHTNEPHTCIGHHDDSELTYEEAKKPIHGVITLESVNKQLKELDCKKCGNYIDEEFSNANCTGCSKNPFYMNCFTPISKPKYTTG